MKACRGIASVDEDAYWSRGLARPAVTPGGEGELPKQTAGRSHPRRNPHTGWPRNTPRLERWSRCRSPLGGV